MGSKLNPERIDGADEVAASEVLLCLVNEGRFYRQIEYSRANLAKKVAKGIYNPLAAAVLWYYAVDRYLAEYYYPENYGGGTPFRFSVPTRMRIARELEQNQREQVYTDGGYTLSQIPSFPSDL